MWYRWPRLTRADFTRIDLHHVAIADRSRAYFECMPDSRKRITSELLSKYDMRILKLQCKYRRFTSSASLDSQLSL